MNFNPNITFTLEIEKDSKINFLDLTLEHIHNKIEFDIYRKPTFTDITIPSSSNHPIPHKLAAYNSMIHRAFAIPLSKDKLEQEIKIIKYIGTNNGFNEKTIHKLITKKRLKLACFNIYPYVKDNNSKYVSLTFFGEISLKIANILSSHNLIVSFRPHITLKHFFFNCKDKTEKFERSGVYKLKCLDCSAFYLGQTGRTFKKRYSEHLRSFRLQKSDSTFANHLIEDKHRFPELDNLEIIHVENKGFKLNVLESLEIYKSSKIPSNNLLNDQIDLYRTTLFGVFR